MIIGMDFGTTNTGAAVYNGEQVRLLALDPTSATPEVCRSAIYMTRTGDFFLGSAAISTYFDQNIGRPTRFRKVWVGEIMQVFAELPVFYRDVFVYEDEFSPGRLFTSIKTALRSRDYYGTAFRGAWYSASDLVSIYLMGMKLELEKQLGEPVNQVVLGRPVHFSNDAVEDQIAQSRLLDAAFKAGFEKVYLELEPVAAALAYERELEKRELILVFDFGGGTLDFTVMEVGGRGPRRVLATGGLPIAGDVFDQRLFRATIPPHLGEGLEYRQGNARRPIPAHIFDTLSQPPEILSLNTPQNLEILQQIHAGSFEPEKTQALLKVVSSNYALMLFERIERAKRALSSEYLHRLVVETPDFSFSELITRPTLERAIAAEAAAIRGELLATLERSGLQPAAIERVIRTGGSSQIPLFIDLLGEIFGAQKVRAIDTFSSVTSGLAVRGWQIQAGQAELALYTPTSAGRSQEQAVGVEHAAHDPAERHVLPVDLQGVMRRLQVRQIAQLEPEQLPAQILFTLSHGKLSAVEADSWLSDAGIDPSLRLELPPSLQAEAQMVLVGIDQHLLIATNQLKLISLPARTLFLAQQADPHGIGQSLPLDVDEFVTALLTWMPEQPAWPVIVMVTAAGQGRAFEAVRLAETIGRRPFFQLERRYNGFPVRLMAASGQAIVLAGSDQGRLGRAALNELAVQPYDLLRLRSREALSAAAVCLPGQPVAAINNHGQWLSFDPQSLPAGGPPAQRGQYLRRGFNMIGLCTLDELLGGHLLAATSLGRLLRLDSSIDLSQSTHTPRRLFKLLPEEEALFCFPT